MSRFIQLFGMALVMLCFSAMAQEAVKAPKDFTLKEINGEKEFTLSKAKGKYVALHFLLKTECPFCLRHTHSYAENAEKFPNVVQVFIKPDTVEEIKAWAGKFDNSDDVKTPMIYRDPDARLAEAFGIPNGYEFHGQVVHYPALVLLDPDGKEVFRYVGKSNRDRFDIEKFEAKMKELESK
ncbi:MAG: redoxin domain-containing protein [bacterium]|nr:redoxin domain-containing protein [bacterium]